MCHVLISVFPGDDAMTTKTGTAVKNVINEHTSPFIDFFKQYLTVPFFMRVIATVIVILIIYIIYRIIERMIKRLPAERLRPHTALLLEKTIKYLFYICILMYILGLFGIKFSAVWGAAGVAGVALGFAAQTSVSNIISGMFVMSEHSMAIGDLITVDGMTGIVDSIDMLSVKIHTLDNQLVRVPNSTIINSNLVNTSFFPKRRMTIGVSVSYDTDIKRALEMLGKVPAICPTVIEDPLPAAWVDGFGSSGINLVLAVWFNAADFLQTKNDVFIAIKKVFDYEKISIPFNRIDVRILNDGISAAVKAPAKEDFAVSAGT